MAHQKLKNTPQISLLDLLRKRRTNLKSFIKEYGMTTYTGLTERCRKLGVSPPSESVFQESLGGKFSSPQEGLIVLDPPDLVKDSGEKVKVDSFVDHDVPAEDPEPAPVAFSTTKSSKRSKRTWSTETVDVSPSEDVELK